ncbi:MAG: hypothetical protein FWF72_00455, partial [Paludibacter sp.]|nr:hypothetical protein [Paludibacter sp.]
MRKIIFIAFAALFCLQLSAQKTKVTVGKLYKSKQGILQTAQIGDNIFAVTIDAKETKFSLLTFDKSLNCTNEAVFFDKNAKNTTNTLQGNFKFVQAYFYADKVMYFFQTFEKTNNKTLLLCQQADYKGNFIGKFTVIDQIDDSKKKNAGKFELVISEDSTKFAVIKHLPYDKKADESVIVTSFTSDLKQIATKEAQFPFKDKNAVIRQSQISNKGNLFFLFYVKLEKNQQQKGEDNDFFSLVSVNLSTNKDVVEYRLTLPQKNMLDAAIKIDNKNSRILASGFYSNIKTSAKRTKDIDGFYYLSLDETTREVISQATKQFPANLVNQLNSKDADKEVKEGQGISNTFDIIGFYAKPDGSTLIVSEIRFIVITRMKGATFRDYYFHNLLLISISADGKDIAFYDIPKRQRQKNDIFLSAMTMQNG